MRGMRGVVSAGDAAERTEGDEGKTWESARESAREWEIRFGFLWGFRLPVDGCGQRWTAGDEG
jgi:hypothetical protein